MFIAIWKKTKFTVHQLDCNNSEKIEIERNYICLPMPLKLKWNVNELCEFKCPRNNQWYLGKIIDFDSITSILSVEITETGEG